MGVQVIKDNIPEVIAALHAGRDDMAVGVAKGMEGYAQDFAPVLTGALRAGVQSEGTGGGSAEVTASSVQGGADREYSHYVEYGTRYMAAQPFMMQGFAAGVATSVPVEGAKFGAKIEAAAG